MPKNVLYFILFIFIWVPLILILWNSAGCSTSNPC